MTDYRARSVRRPTHALGAMAAVVGLLHVAGIVVLSGEPALAGVGIVAYLLGVRHAFDARHVAVIAEFSGRGPLTAGFWFSLGSATTVFSVTFLLAMIVQPTASTTPAGVFLAILGALNLVVLIGALMGRGRGYDGSAARYGLMGRLSRWVRHPWQLFPLGVIVGFGLLITAETGLLLLAATAAVPELPLAAIITQPLLFAAGLCLVGAVQGVRMSTPTAEPTAGIVFTTTVAVGTLAIAAVDLAAIDLPPGLLPNLAGLPLAAILLVVLAILAFVAIRRYRRRSARPAPSSPPVRFSTPSAGQPSTSPAGPPFAQVYPPPAAPPAGLPLAPPPEPPLAPPLAPASASPLAPTSAPPLAPISALPLAPASAPPLAATAAMSLGSSSGSSLLPDSDRRPGSAPVSGRAVADGLAVVAPRRGTGSDRGRGVARVAPSRDEEQLLSEQPAASDGQSTVRGRAVGEDTVAGLEPSGVVAVVTGAGAGLGRAIALGLAASGYGVVAVDLDAASAEACAVQALAYGVAARAMAADVRDPRFLERIVAAAGELGASGGPSVLVNSVAGWVAERYPQVEAWVPPTLDLTDVTLLSQLVLDPMRSRGGGAIVNVIAGGAGGDQEARLVRFTGTFAGVAERFDVRAMCVTADRLIVPAADVLTAVLDLIDSGAPGAVVHLRGGHQDQSGQTVRPRGTGKAGRASGAPVGRVSSGEVGRVSSGEVGRVGSGEVVRVSSGEVGRAGGAPVGRVSSGEVGRVGGAPVGRVSSGEVGRVGSGEVSRGGEVRRAGSGGKAAGAAAGRSGAAARWAAAAAARWAGAAAARWAGAAGAR
ncbi:SDR family NAD(P)-dependent oxidoreductase [Actinoplanes sp. CA-131856]